MTSDSGRLPQGGDAKQAPCEASQSGAQRIAQTQSNNPPTSPDGLLKLAERVEAYDPKMSPDNRADELELHRDIVMETGVGSMNPAIEATFVRSLDAAMTLVPPGWEPLIDGVGSDRAERWIVELYPEDGDDRIENGAADTAPLALCAAALKARASQ
jgi:hypothetical protein